MASVITLFHFTTWPLTDKDVGKIFDVSWDVSNYWKQKLTKGWVPSIATLPDNVVVNGVNLSQLNELLNQMKYTSELLKEYVLDEIRSNEYPLKPSRRKCMFAFSTKHDPDEYAKRLGFDRTRYQLLTLRVLPDTRLHSGDMGLLNTNLSDYQGYVDAARQYWTGSDDGLPLSEVLLEGQVELIRLD